MSKKIAIIPARGGSKRIPRKNIVEICGNPMICYPIHAALSSDMFDRVIVSTEDKEIKQISLDCGAEVIDRPMDLATDRAMEIDVYEHVLDALWVNEQYAPDFFCGIYPTAILVNPECYRDSFEKFHKVPEAGALMSVSEYPVHPFKAMDIDNKEFLRMTHPEECLRRSQTYPRYVASNGTFYWFRTDGYRAEKSYYPENLMAYVLPKSQAIDIDTPEDLAIAGAILSLKNPGRLIERKPKEMFVDV